MRQFSWLLLFEAEFRKYDSATTLQTIVWTNKPQNPRTAKTEF